jgi:hypothetical protein
MKSGKEKALTPRLNGAQSPAVIGNMRIYIGKAEFAEIG